MKSSEFLFELIHSLSKTEKRYFKRYTSLHGTTEKNYVQLFDDVLKMDVYDEGIVKKKYAGGYADNFGMMKQLLFQQIMKSLSSFYADSSIEHEILSIIRDIKILQKKGLYAIAEKKINRGIKLCLECERLGFLPQLYSHKKSNIYQSFYIDTSYEALEKIISDEKHAFAKINEITTLVNMMLKFFYLRTTAESLKRNEYDTIINQLNTSYYDYTFSSQSIRLHILTTHYIDNGLFLKANKAMLEHINLYNKYPKIKQEYFFNFLNLNYNFINGLIAVKKFDAAEEELQKAELNKNLHKGYESVFFILHNTTLMSLYQEKKSYEKIIELKRKLYKGNLLNKQNLTVEVSNIFDFNFAISYFTLGNYDQSIFHLQNIINGKLNNQMTFSSAKILLFLCHFELHNFSILSSLGKSILRILKINLKKETTNEYVFIECFTKMYKPNITNQELKAILLEIKKHLNRKQKSFINSIDIFEWIDKKIKTY